MMHVRPSLRPSNRHRPGTTLIEAMILMVVLSIIVLGTGVALTSLVRVPGANNNALVISNLLEDKMEKLKALGYTGLAGMASGSDTVTINNATYTRSWTITSNPGGSYDTNFLQVTVTIGTQSFVTGVCKQ